MTLDNTTPDTTDATAKKPARRRVTRAAAAPAGGTSTPETTPATAPESPEQPAEKPVRRRAAAKKAPAATEPAAAEQPPAALAEQAPEASVPTVAEATTAPKAPRRSRRVTKTTEQLDVFAELSATTSSPEAPSTTTAAVPTAEPVASAGETPPAAPRRRRAASRPASSTAPAQASQDRTAEPALSQDRTAEPAPSQDRTVEPAPAADQAPAAPAAEQAVEPAATGTRAPRRSRSRAAAPATVPTHEDEVASLDVVASIEALTAEPAAAPARRSRRATSAAPTTAAPALFEDDEVARPRRAATRRAAAPASADAEPVQAAAQAEPVAEPTSSEHVASTQPDAPRKTRSRRSRSAEPAEAPVAQAAPAAQPEPAPVERTEALPAAAESVDETPRRTTALLFQAPDPDAARPRRRRAQTPAGPPKAVSEAAAAAADEAVEDDEAEVTDELLDLGIHQADEITATQDDDDHDTDGSEDDDPEDTDEDDSDGQPRRRRRRGGRGRRNRGSSDSRDDDRESRQDDDRDSREDDDPADSEDEAEVSDEPRGRSENGRSRSRRRGRGAGPAQDSDPRDDEAETTSEDGGPSDDTDDHDDSDESASSRRRRRRRRGSRGADTDAVPAAAPSGRTSGGAGSSRSGRTGADEVTALKGSTRLEAKRQRRREGRDNGRRRSIITEAEFLARRESVERSMIVRERNGRTQIAVLEDGVLVEHYVSQQSQASMAGNVYLGRVQNVLPSMEAAFVDVGKGRNAVLYAGEVNWDAHGLEGAPRRIEQALKSGDPVLVQVTKDPIGQKGARLTSQVTLAGRYLVYVPGGGMTGISRKLPDTERARLKKILREVVPETAGVIVRTAAEGASEEELRADIARLQGQWEAIEKKSKSASAPALLQGEPDLAIRVVRDIFNDDFSSLTISGDGAWSEISEYVNALAPDLAGRVKRWTSEKDVFAEARIDEQLAKGMDRKVWLPSGGSLVIDRTEAMTVVDVNTGKFTGSGGTLEETVTRNNLEAAEEIVRQLRLRDIGGIIVVDFIDMVLESNRDLVLRRMVECLGRDRTKHQVAEVTSLGLVQMTRKRVGQGLVEAFSETCDHCNGRGFIVHDEPNEKHFQGGSQPSGAQVAAQSAASAPAESDSKRGRRKRGAKESEAVAAVPVLPEAREAVKATLATIAAAAAHAHEHEDEHTDSAEHGVAAEHGVVVTVDVETAEIVDVRQPGSEEQPEFAPAEPAAEAVEQQEPKRPVLDVVAELRSVRRPVSGQGGGEQTDQQ